MLKAKKYEQHYLLMQQIFMLQKVEDASTFWNINISLAWNWYCTRNNNLYYEDVVVLPGL